MRVGGARRQHRCRKAGTGERKQLTTIHDAPFR
jgi:hypothetical protein